MEAKDREFYERHKGISDDDWCSLVETIDPNTWIELPETDVFFKDRGYFEACGFTDEILNKVHTFVNQQYYSLFQVWKFARAVPEGGTILEIGSGQGGSLITMGLANPTAKLVNIDSFAEYTEETYAGTGTGSFSYQTFADNIAKMGLSERVTTIQKLADDAADDIEDESIDLLFDDGNHSYECVKSEIEKYIGKVKSGGVLCGHDYHPRFPGVIKAVKEYFGEGNYSVGKLSSVWAVKVVR